MNNTVLIRRIGNTVDALGEGPVWDPVDGALYWIDSLGPVVRRYTAAHGHVESWDLPGRTVGSLALREAGGLILAMDDGFCLFDVRSGSVDPLATIEGDEPRTRFNDGKVDRRGRFVAGSMDADQKDPLGVLYRLDPDGTCTALDSGFVVCNGPCWSPDDTTLYFSDSWRATIYAYDYDIETGAVSNRRDLISTRGLKGAPDGCTVDAQGNLWSALVLSGTVGCFAPDGTLLRQIDVPVRNLTSVAFGGPNLDILYVTSAGQGIAGRPSEDAQAGGLFAITGLGVTGLPEPRFAG